MGIPAVTLGNGYTGGIPALSATYALGATLAGTPGLRMRLFANVSRTPGTTTNVIADSKRGDASNVVMAGAHLDSVAEGPGINDNGSGSSALLEVAEQMSKVKTENRVRFAWWGAEEAGLVGSTFYVNDLVANDEAGLDAIELYLNFDMVASPNYGLFRYDGDGSDFGLVGPDGSDEIEATFEPLLLRAEHPVGVLGLQRSVRLPGVHQQRHPLGWPVHRRRRHQDRRAGGQVGRDCRPGLRPLLPRGLRHDRQPQQEGTADQRRRHRVRGLPVRIGR